MRPTQLAESLALSRFLTYQAYILNLSGIISVYSYKHFEITFNL